ncbi:MAG TPA: alpha/beta hydrolase [Candidatus Dormibacteraeota bacterium]
MAGEHTITSNGARLRYLREGAGEPVLLLHGYLFGADSWRPQIDTLRTRFDVIALDLRGQFGSEVTAGGYDLWNQAEDVREVIEALGVAPVHLVGLSMGGMIGLRLALRHPDAVRSLVLMDTTSGPENPELVERYEAMAEVVEAGDIEAVAPALPPVFLADDFIVEHSDQVDAWLDRVRAADPIGFVHALRALNTRDDVSERLGEIAVPTLVIHGEEDVAIPVERARELQAGIAAARLAMVGGAHQSNVDRAEETTSLILDFLVSIATPAADGRT